MPRSAGRGNNAGKRRETQGVYKQAIPCYIRPNPRGLPEVHTANRRTNMRALTDATAGLLKPVDLEPQDRLHLDIENDRKTFRATIKSVGKTWQDAYPSLAATRVWISRVPERKRVEQFANTWLFKATDYTAEIINAVWPRDKIVFESEEARIILDYLLLTTTAQDHCAEVTAAYKERGEVPKHDLTLHPDLPLAKYQQVALVNSLASEGYGLFMEQGTGKTPVVVARVCNEAPRIFRQEQRLYRALIVCPNSVRLNWLREFERFCTVGGKVNIIKGGEIERMSQLIEAMLPEDECMFTACIISYDGMVRTWDAIGNIDWDLAVLDEAHYIKWPETKRAKMAMRLRDKARARMVLTGTPVCNTPLDLYSLFEFMGEGWSGFQSWKNFRDFYGVFNAAEGDAHRKLVGIQNLPFMKERLARTSFIIRKEEALPDLPEKVYDTYEVEMNASQAEAYQHLAESMLHEIEEQLENSENKTITINNILTQLLRLAQVTAGYIVWDEVIDPNSMETLRAKNIEFFSPDPKLEALVEILKEKEPNQKTIVWSCFVPCIKTISERLTREGIDHVTFYGGTSDDERVEAERRFNYDPSCKVVVGNPAAGGVGLNLLGYPPHGGENYETNCDHVIYYAQNWSMVQRAQSEDRAHRRGTRTNVRITDLVVPDTIDEEIRVRVLKKKLVALEVADIREILQAALKGVFNA